MSTVKTRLVEIAYRVLVLGVATAWSLFWGMVARIHYLQGDLSSMMFTTVVFVVPAVAGFVWYLGKSFDVDVPMPNVDANVLSS